MYKITIRQIVGDVIKETIIETDDLEFAKNILVSEVVIKVETDVANESIDPDMTTLKEAFKKHLEDIWKDPTNVPCTKWPSPGSPSPFTITC